MKWVSTSADLWNAATKYMLDRFHGLHRNQKFDAFLSAATAVGVTLGVILTISESKFFSGKGKADDDQSPER